MNKIGQKRKDRQKVAKAKVAKRRQKLQNERKVQEELDRMRDEGAPRTLPIRNNYE